MTSLTARYKNFKSEYAYTKKASSQWGGGGGVRTPCTVPLDPPLGAVNRVGESQSSEKKNSRSGRKARGK